MSVQIPVRIPDEDARRLDDVVASGRFASRSDALREGLALLLREEREREIVEAYRRGYERFPQEDRVGQDGLILFEQHVLEEGESEPL
ncbi:MAG: ribbon-helix-helix domain-containing protein [Gaiellaceae bacterium]